QRRISSRFLKRATGASQLLEQRIAAPLGVWKLRRSEVDFLKGKRRSIHRARIPAARTRDALPLCNSVACGRRELSSWVQTPPREPSTSVGRPAPPLAQKGPRMSLICRRFLRGRASACWLHNLIVGGHRHEEPSSQVRTRAHTGPSRDRR